MLERTLVLLKPSTIQRALIGEVVNRFEKKGLRIAGMKMLQLDDAILEEHYAHLVKKPFFPSLKASMMKTPVIAMCLEGVDARMLHESFRHLHVLLIHTEIHLSVETGILDVVRLEVLCHIDSGPVLCRTSVILQDDNLFFS